MHGLSGGTGTAFSFTGYSWQTRLLTGLRKKHFFAHAVYHCTITVRSAFSTWFTRSPAGGVPCTNIQRDHLPHTYWYCLAVLCVSCRV